MPHDLKPMLLGKLSFHFFQELNFLVDEIVIVDDAFTDRADQVMVMTRFRQTLDKFIAAAPVPEMELHHNPHLFEQIKGTVDRRQSDVWVRLVDLHVDFLCRDMFLRTGQNIHDNSPGFGDAQSLLPETGMQLKGIRVAHGRLIDNGYR